jgi:hypothetical protein
LTLHHHLAHATPIFFVLYPPTPELHATALVLSLDSFCTLATMIPTSATT